VRVKLNKGDSVECGKSSDSNEMKWCASSMIFFVMKAMLFVTAVNHEIQIDDL